LVPVFQVKKDQTGDIFSDMGYMGRKGDCCFLFIYPNTILCVRYNMTWYLYLPQWHMLTNTKCKLWKLCSNFN